MALVFKICILYNSKSSLMSECLGTNDVVVTRVLCGRGYFEKSVSKFREMTEFWIIITDETIYTNLCHDLLPGNKNVMREK